LRFSASKGTALTTTKPVKARRIFVNSCMVKQSQLKKYTLSLKIPLSQNYAARKHDTKIKSKKKEGIYLDQQLS
jgi:hypothetical protein